MALKDFKFENLSRSTQLIVALALAAGLISLGYMLYLKDPIQRRNALQAEIRKLEVAVAQATAVESQITRFKQELVQLDLRLRELRRIHPSHKETPNVLLHGAHHAYVGVGLRKLEQFPGLGQSRRQLVEGADNGLELRALAAELLRAFGLGPDRGVREFAQHLGQSLAAALVVKDTP